MRLLKLLCLLIAALAIPSPATAKPNLIKVDCDKGKTIKDALKHAEPGDTILVMGTCTERVVIKTNRITLDGDGTAVLDGAGGGPTGFGEGGILVIEGADGVLIKGLTVQNGNSHGISGRDGATFAVRGSTVRDIAVAGILVLNNSYAELKDVVVQRARGIGIVVENTSTAVLKGSISSTASGSNGISVQSGSTLEIRGASVQSTENGGGGVDIVDSQLVIFGFPESQGTVLVADRNASDGIFVATGGLLVTGRIFAGTGSLATISTSNNGGDGLTVGPYGAVVSPFAAAKFISKNNRVGVLLSDSASALLIGGLTVEQNQTGLLADAAGTLTLVSVPSNPSSITGNTTVDVDLRFGTRATLGEVTIGTIVCETTVLSRGSTVCP
jgi:hypothetical protein